MWFFKKKKKEQVQPIVVEPVKPSLSINDFVIHEDLDEEEKELVSVITSCIAASDLSLAQFKIRSIKEIDQDKEIAAALVGAICAHDRPHSQFRLISIEERK